MVSFVYKLIHINIRNENFTNKVWKMKLNKVSKFKIYPALVVKLVDTKDLKSLPFWECQFESGRGHQIFY